MFYKKEKNGNWLVGKIVNLPNGEKLTEDNKQSIDGWEWFKTPPKEYLNWKSEQELNDEII